LFELLYRGITMPVYLRFINRALRFALEMAGYSYLTAANIGSFLVRPWTLLAIFAAGIIGILFLLLEIAGLITAFQGSAYYQKLTPFHILWGALHKVANEAGRHDWKLGLVVLVDYFLMNLFLIGRGLSHIKPVNFVIQEMMSEPSVLFFFSVLLAGSVVIAVPSLFACFGCMVEQKTFTESMKRSRKLLKGPSVPGSAAADFLQSACGLCDRIRISAVRLCGGCICCCVYGEKYGHGCAFADCRPAGAAVFIFGRRYYGCELFCRPVSHVLPVWKQQAP